MAISSHHGSYQNKNHGIEPFSDLFHNAIYANALGEEQRAIAARMWAL